MLILENFRYVSYNDVTHEEIMMDNYHHPIDESDDVHQYIEIIFSCFNVTFKYIAPELQNIGKTDWTNLILVNGYQIRLTNAFDSDCDNGNVIIKNVDGQYLSFMYNTSTGDHMCINIPVDQCLNAIGDLASKYCSS